MKLKKTRSCEGCRAVTSTYRGSTECGLGFNNKGKYIQAFGMYRITPQEPCYKPLTIPELLEAEELVRQKKT